MARPLVRAVFGALLLATFAAFFVAQQLKSEFPLVLRFAAVPSAFSPNNDGVRDFTFLGFDLSKTADVKFSIVDSNGNEVRTFVDKRLAGSRKYRFIWHGRDNQGKRVPDGSYRMRVIRIDEGRVINSLKDVVVDTKPPRVRLVSARPGVIVPGVRGAEGPVRIRYRGPKNRAPEMRIFRTDGGPPRVVARFRGDDRNGATWSGTIRGKPPADGDYAFTVTVRDRAGNRAVAPREVPTRATALAGTGVAVRRLTLAGPLGVAPAGSLARLTAGPARRRLRFAVYRLGARRPLRAGIRSGGPFPVRIPRGAQTGVYLVSVRAGGSRAVWPLAVRRRAGPAGRRPLVVLPAIGWQGSNPVDDDLDGFADTLADARSVGLARPFANGRLPAGFRGGVESLLRFLDRRRLAYDLTTDLALARGDGPTLADARGVVFPGRERWLPVRLQRSLAAYVRSGGTLASFGDDSFKRGVQVEVSSLRDPSASAARDAFGEATRLERLGAAPLLVEDDRLGLFGGGSSLGDFTVFERSLGLGSGARLLTSAGRALGERDLVAYRLGKGTVFRSGTPQWASRLAADTAVADATLQLWRLLRRG